MRRILACMLMIALGGGSARTDGILFPSEVERINRCIQGQVLDFTQNHGKDRRIWSNALCAKRDLYVYLPPGYTPAKKYPLVIFLHGAGQDERMFLPMAKSIDKKIVDGKIPPMVVAIPDGAILERPSVIRMASFWANTKAGRFEDYVMEDVWSFLMENFSIRPDRESHALIGVSMGGAGAYNMAIKHKDRIKIAMGFLPALNLRWVDCHGNYESSFDPECWGWRERKRPFEVIGRPKGPFVIRARDLYGHLIGHGPDAMLKLARINPIEVMDQYDLQPGDLHLYIGYGGKDEFNIMAQVESFLFRARERKIDIHVDFDPDGRHDAASARRLMPGAMDWFAALIPK